MNESANVQKLPPPVETTNDLTISTGLAVMSPEQAKKAVGYLQDIKKSILQRGVDFGKIPGAGNKDVLFKAGAQKLCAFFSLAPHYSVTHRQEDFFKEWEYIAPVYEWRNRQRIKVGERTEKTKGFYSYEISCELKHRTTNEVWATGSGTCNSSERGRETAPSNTILKMTEKRAFLQAVLDATFSSELFTQDVEDFTDKEPEKPKPEKKASKDQLSEISALVSKHELPDAILEKAMHFGHDESIQTDTNAKALIAKLKSLPLKAEVDKHRSELMEKSKDWLVAKVTDLLGHKFGGDIKAGDGWIDIQIAAGNFHKDGLSASNKGQLCNAVLELEKSQG